ncbi:pilus assembly protein CpaC [Cricetibacter osteomyelitidis]|uniref:Pilus assembly protein CpaC n=1 Tax=Cricetibacter osteomyelitidis TaxID=1521931 RepID=A0A4R2T1H5_9PAST|nr:type II and III secretion system protein family protein [Cricetibacter osteomyelitidis]TCP94654.1 pilus assembly protein CpaC [Cricetibacter osteomyelitidis]
MFTCNNFKRKLVSSLVGLVFVCSSTAYAKTFNLEQGSSEIIQTKKKIDTIFVSSPEIADYEILDDYSFIIYAKGEGRAQVSAFAEDGETLTEDTVNVNQVINNISAANEQIQARFPNSDLSVKKVGKAYVIEGRARTQEESDEINRIVGEALGGSKKTVETKFKIGGSSDDEKLHMPFLDKYIYDGVVNNAVVDDITQINVKLTVVEVNKTFSDKLGINWSHIAGANAGSGILGGSYSFGGGFNSSNGGVLRITAPGLSAFISALDTQSNGRILAEPNISMLSGESADILVGGEIPFTQRDRDGNVTVIYKDFGVGLTVGAKLQKNNRIRLVLNQNVSIIAGSYNYEQIGSIPYFNTRRATSVFEVADGESFILGGLLNSQDIENVNKVPFLGDIPILGAFFRDASTTRENKELVVVATVNTVKAVNNNDIVYPNFERTGTMERFFNVTPLKNVYHKTLTSNFLKNGGFIQ